MKIPYRLRRTCNVRSTRALLIPGHDGAVVLRLCARLGIDSPRIFAVKDGFLVRLPQPLDKPVAGAIRLGELATNLLLPVDAELAPALLADEAEALGRRRGLIFLPDGRVLEFAAAEPIELAALVTIDGLRRRAWQELPEPPALAHRINEIAYHRPDDIPDAIIERGGDGIGEETPQPDDASFPRKLLGNTAMGLGRGLRWLGNVLHLKTLANLGGKLMAGGLALVPRLSEKIMGKQEAGLRELLEEFRKGNVDKALRRALPLGGSGTRGAAPHQGTQLPTHQLGYSLGNILGGWGPASLWYTPDQLFHELQREYRKQAEAASRRGDYRRAAFIYGKLLGDFAMAAASLAQGGLHHDAAIVYLKRLQDYLAAAREFAAAGEIDEALRLYRQRREHVHAGDLLRRLGEEDLAVAEFTQAADLLVANGHGYFQAGELMLSRAERPDLAKGYFAAGWQSRPGVSAVMCGRRLAELHAQNADTCSLLRLTDEAQDFLQAPGNEALAAEFCNEIARLAERPTLAPIQEQLRDRCLMTLAHKVRQGWGNMGPLVAQLFPAGAVWETPLVGDVQYAARTAQHRRAPWITATPAAAMVIRGRIPIVRSVCQAPESGEIFLGYESGEIACFHPGRGDVQFLPSQNGPVYGLAVDVVGRELVALSASENPAHHLLSCYSRLGQWQIFEAQVWKESPHGFRLCTTLARTSDLIAGLLDASSGELYFLRLPRLLPEGSIALSDYYPLTGIPLMLREYHPHAVLENFKKGNIRCAACLLFDGREMCHVTHSHGETGKLESLRWVPCGIPGQPANSSLDATPLSWICKSPGRLEVAGIGAEGALSWLDLEFQAGELINTTSKSAPGPFRAAALIRSGVIAAVANDGITWMRASAGGIKEQCRQRISLADVVACFANHDIHELIVIGGNGSVTRVREAV
jgi:tetratricopeptide (TPR) repeat protein